MNYQTAFAAAQKSRASRQFPDRSDSRCVNGRLVPHIDPTFRIEGTSKRTVFTVGSCFARSIEEALAPLGFVLPTCSFAVPKEEYPYRPNGLLNEYNPGTMSQRLLFALEGRECSVATLAETDSGVCDLLLPDGTDVSMERALARRGEINAVYSRLKESDLVIITLGFIEAWFDTQTGSYLNRVPPVSAMKCDPTRYIFRMLDIPDALPLLERAFAALHDFGLKVILTVSPVPLNTTFSGSDCVVANEFSKSVLRVCAERLRRRFPNVDYFPSYEIVRSGGLTSYEQDNIHVVSSLVNEITSLMTRAYFT